MEAPIQAILFLGIIPALLFLFLALKGYEGYYKDKIIFITFVIGIIFGVIAAAVRIIINPPYLIPIGTITFISRYTIIYIVLFAFIEQLLKTIVLNIGRFQLKKETTIYGLALGLGFGSSFTPFLIISLTSVGNVSLSFLSLVIFGSLGFILFHAAMGSFIGYGIFSGKMTKHLFIAIFLQIPFNTIAELTRVYEKPYFTYYLIYQIGLVIYGAIIFIYVIKKVMPKILSQGERRKRIKKKKKE